MPTRLATLLAVLFATALPLPAQDIDRAAWRARLAPDAAAPTAAELPALLDALTALLGSPDPELRDDVAYSLLAKWLVRDRIVPVEQRHRMLDAWLASLCAGIGEHGTDGVARRSFSALALSLLVALDNQEPWLDRTAFARLLAAAVAYLHDEVDVRGFDNKLGWLHSVAHTADLLKMLARSKHLAPAEQATILQAIADKLGAVPTPLVDGEDERLARAVVAIAARDDGDAAALRAWLDAVDGKAAAGTAEERVHDGNRRHVLAALCTLLAIDDSGKPSIGRARELVTTRLRAGPTPSKGVAPPVAREADVASVDAIVKALYDVISGPAGVARDWDRMRSLFHPDARLIPVVGAGDNKRARLLTVDDYARRSGPLLERDGFFEREVARATASFGDIVHVWSTYEGRRAERDGEPFLRGINSIQLVRQQGRWFVLHVLWESEADGGPLPAEYLPPGRPAK